LILFIIIIIRNKKCLKLGVNIIGGLAKARASSIASSWVEENIHSVVLVGNSLMGSPKVLNSMLTGNIREVLSLWAPARSILENVRDRCFLHVLIFVFLNMV
jgi:hypothetical protein